MVTRHVQSDAPLGWRKFQSVMHEVGKDQLKGHGFTPNDRQVLWGLPVELNLLPSVFKCLTSDESVEEVV